MCCAQVDEMRSFFRSAIYYCPYESAVTKIRQIHSWNRRT